MLNGYQIGLLYNCLEVFDDNISAVALFLIFKNLTDLTFVEIKNKIENFKISEEDLNNIDSLTLEDAATFNKKLLQVKDIEKLFIRDKPLIERNLKL